jgi:hypothetical protein
VLAQPKQGTRLEDHDGQGSLNLFGTQWLDHTHHDGRERERGVRLVSATQDEEG